MRYFSAIAECVPTHIDFGPVINILHLIEKVDEAETLKINATENTQAENK